MHDMAEGMDNKFNFRSYPQYQPLHLTLSRLASTVGERVYMSVSLCLCAWCLTNISIEEAKSRYLC